MTGDNRIAFWSKIVLKNTHAHMIAPQRKGDHPYEQMRLNTAKSIYSPCALWPWTYPQASLRISALTTRTGNISYSKTVPQNLLMHSRPHI